MNTNLRSIPGVGKATEQDLVEMGYTDIESPNTNIDQNNWRP